MSFIDVKEWARPGKGVLTTGLCLATLTTLATTPACSKNSAPTPDAAAAPLRLMIDFPPLTLNPRRASDPSGQRLGELIFRALTRIDAEQAPRPDLASGWRIIDGGRTWRFAIRPALVDHDGAPITAARVAECLESYRVGKPVALTRASFPGWASNEAQGDDVVVRFERPSPYFARNASLLRYFTVEGSTTPCSEPPPGSRVIGSGLYRPERWDVAPEGDLLLLPTIPDRRSLLVSIVPDDNARVLKLLRGEVDVTQNAISLTKQRWIQKSYPERFDFLEREGPKVRYLAFNLRDPLLSRREVRQAISLAIDRESIVRHKLMGMSQVAGSLLSPHLPESGQSTFRFDPAQAERLLDQAGLPRPKPGAARFELRYRTTPVREGFETGLIIQDQLARIGIRVVLDVVEPAVFLSAIRKGVFQLYSSNWVGIADASILFRTLRSGQPDNRVKYANPEMDRILDLASAEPDDQRRIELSRKAQSLMAEDLPYFPLWYWNNFTIVRKGLKGLSAGEIAFNGSYEPLTRLR
jgi:peptide/nickel transport system substrate-binding protein